MQVVQQQAAWETSGGHWRRRIAAAGSRQTLPAARRVALRPSPCDHTHRAPQTKGPGGRKPYLGSGSWHAKPGPRLKLFSCFPLLLTPETKLRVAALE